MVLAFLTRKNNIIDPGTPTGPGRAAMGRVVFHVEYTCRTEDGRPMSVPCPQSTKINKIMN